MTLTDYATSVWDSTTAQDDDLTYQIYLMMIYCHSHPHNPHCDGVPSYYMYRISLLANAVFAGVFLFSLVVFAATYAATRRGHGFNAAMMLGVACETLGYAGRILSWNNPWEEDPFLLQVCSLTIGPAFLAAGIYLCLRCVVRVFGTDNSRIAPEWYARVFIPCDLVSLVLQAAGGGLAAVANQRWESTETGDKVMIAGLAFQVFTMFVFMLVAGDFAIRTWRRRRRRLADGDAAVLSHLRSSWKFRFFLGALAVSTVCIFWRSVFRVAELSGGWTGPLMERQDLFIGFEGVMIAVAVLGLNFFHPGLCSPELLGGGSKAGRDGRLWEDPSSGSETKVEAV